MSGKDVRGCCEYLQQLISIYDYYENWVKVEELLGALHHNIEFIKSPPLELQLERMVIGNHIKLIPILQIEKAQTLLEETVNALSKITNEKEYYLIEHPLDKLQIQYLEAQLAGLRDGLVQGQTALESLLKEVALWSDYFGSQGDRSSLDELVLLKAKVLEEIGDIERHSEADQKAVAYYCQAFECYRAHFGTFYQLECGLVGEKIGLIEKEKGNRDQYEDCRELLINILDAKYGKHHKHAIRIKDNMENSPKKPKNSKSFVFVTHRHPTTTEPDLTQ